jgi:dTDP-4-amino-4,6-dideoxygalactose transaminase
MMMTSRFDTIQAAILSEKLKIFPNEIAARDFAAQRYAAADACLSRHRDAGPRCRRRPPCAQSVIVAACCTFSR